MHSVDELVDLLDAAAEPWAGAVMYRAEPATRTSMARIEKELDVRVPPLLVELSQRSPGFGVLFAGLGEDWESPGHILRLNETVHRARRRDGIRALPAALVMFNRGEDHECVCWDRDRAGEGGEHPIVWCRTDVGVTRRGGRTAFRRELEIVPAGETLREWIDAECARLLAACELE
jgi:hypothetical protein